MGEGKRERERERERGSYRTQLDGTTRLKCRRIAAAGGVLWSPGQDGFITRRFLPPFTLFSASTNIMKRFERFSFYVVSFFMLDT
jgi:hypothetical protein